MHYLMCILNTNSIESTDISPFRFLLQRHIPINKIAKILIKMSKIFLGITKEQPPEFHKKLEVP